VAFNRPILLSYGPTYYLERFFLPDIVESGVSTVFHFFFHVRLFLGVTGRWLLLTNTGFVMFKRRRVSFNGNPVGFLVDTFSRAYVPSVPSNRRVVVFVYGTTRCTVLFYDAFPSEPSAENTFNRLVRRENAAFRFSGRTSAVIYRVNKRCDSAETIISSDEPPFTFIYTSCRNGRSDHLTIRPRRCPTFLETWPNSWATHTHTHTHTPTLACSRIFDSVFDTSSGRILCTRIIPRRRVRRRRVSMNTVVDAFYRRFRHHRVYMVRSRVRAGKFYRWFSRRTFPFIRVYI